MSTGCFDWTLDTFLGVWSSFRLSLFLHGVLSLVTERDLGRTYGPEWTEPGRVHSEETGRGPPLTPKGRGEPRSSCVTILSLGTLYLPMKA